MANEADRVKYRRLNVGEVIEAGDEYQSEETKVWRRVPGIVVGKVIDKDHLPLRRLCLCGAQPSQHYDLPEAVAALTERVARLEAAVTPKSVSGSIAESLENNGDTVAADGLRTERVTLEVTHRCVQPLADWLLQAIDQVLVDPGENVFVMDSSHEITKLTADLAASKRECERLRDVVRQLSVDQFRRVPIQRNESSTAERKNLKKERPNGE